jgi:hypothetical protein
MHSRRVLVVLVVLVAGVAGIVAAASAIGSSGLVAPVVRNQSGEPVIKSPNGQYSITVGNAGIVLKGPNETVTLSGTGLRAMVPNADLRASNVVNLEAQASAVLRGPTVALTGEKVELNGCAQSVVRGTDTVVVSGTTGKIVPGQYAVCMG